MASELLRMLRVVEFVGTREFLDRQAQGSSWSERRVPNGVIRAAWIGATPSELSPEEKVEETAQQTTERRRNASMVFLDTVAKMDPEDNSVEISDLIRWAKEVQTL